MDIDSTSVTKGSSCGLKENGMPLYPVSLYDSGEGLPYAPEDWPYPGDKWSWKVGGRIAASGYFLDRYMYTPARLREGGRKTGFASKLSLEQYIRKNFPDADVNAFFASFSWKIPSKSRMKDDIELFTPPRETAEHSGSDSQFDDICCKAGNRVCNSLSATEDSVSDVMSCDICCSEPGFCRDCCCILCCKTIKMAFGGYSNIRCEAKIDGYFCGHSAHIECALRAYMAGTVGGTIGLETEYYCRRCDSRTDLVLHVERLLQKCKSVDSRDDIEKILNVGICILRGSEKTSGKQLLHHIEMAMEKLRNGTELEDIWKEEDTAVTGGLSLNGKCAFGFQNYEEPHDHKVGSPQPLSSTFDHRVESLKLEDEIDQILHALRKSQDFEYRLAEERLFAHKNYILNLYQQLDKERSELSRHASLKDPNTTVLDAVQSRIEQIKREVSKLKDMEEAKKGFGRVSKYILKEHFGLEIES
ncbi:protein OBERON 2 isoform X2 [Olea europaea var. sylvestris]|uniref:protein OBERON 2 isoform X2 n=1 Tax=Olea europaea var. sylvestris TaxID=158386 RepID=UPI000C1D0BA3|nr:protein OBERON 2 isoform X2 [Olea europaea var. sylvestris]